MAVFEGKTPAERNKIIAMIVLCSIAVLVLLYSFGGALLPTSGPQTPPVADSSPGDTGSGGGTAGQEVSEIPVNDEIINRDYIVTPVVYSGGRINAPISGRNIFAFYEPPAFTPTPTAQPIATFTPPPPTPEAPMLIRFLTPTNTYAGSKAFRLEVIGEKFTENSRIIFNGNVLPTTYISPERLVATVPQALITRSGGGSVSVNTPDGSLFSYPVAFNIIEPPKPDFDYIGVIARQHYNNDTAYFQDRGRTNTDPFTARLNDVVKSRFKVISISAKEVEFEDVRLGFRHKLELLRPEESSSGSAPVTTFEAPSTRRGRTRTSIPGIPDNIPRAPTTNSNPTREDLNRAIEEMRKRRQQQQQQSDSDNDDEPEPVDDEPPGND